ncbi:MAG: tRNA threonylcarbamoyladenosine dehydratase [Bacteroidales bacterium]|jgi:tRNA A37 threonylcarbamoyladenosine dehydratase|nr:tRNA threonylcarbamoyladenosine dehydratase [Bacteroidales bacterium]
MEWLSRTEMLVGKGGMDQLQSAHVLVVGLGGVGAYAAEMLCRSGIGRLTLIDGDRVQPSNRNRQLLALKSNEGCLKTEVMAERLQDINPEIKLDLISEFIRDDRLIEIISRPYDYVVDAIDTLSPKIFLLYYGLKNKRRIVSSMGAGGKFDPLQIKVEDLSKTYNCRLAYVLRKRLRKLGITEGIKAVFSTEQINKELVEPCDEQNKKSVVGTISYLPAMFGCTCASVVIRDLIEQSHLNSEENE